MRNGEYETPTLIAAARSAGDSKAEAVLYKKYYKGTLYFLELKTSNPQLAQDLCHDAFCALLERLRKGPLDEPDKLLAYLHSIATNLYLTELRKARRQNTFTSQATVNQALDAQESQYRQLLRERTGQGVRQVIAMMRSSRDKKLLYALFVQEKEKAEICTELALSLRHFDKVLYRAKERFKEIILSRKESALSPLERQAHQGHIRMGESDE